MGGIRERIEDTILALDWDIHARLRYSTDPNLGLDTWSTRDDVRRVRHLVPLVHGIGPVRLAQLDQWLSGPAAARLAFVRTVPVAVPPDRVLVHNTVGWPNRRLGSQGFRAWLCPPDAAHLEPCACGWAAELGQHFQPRLVVSNRDLTEVVSSGGDISVLEEMTLANPWDRRSRGGSKSLFLRML